jgi:hypothetical protein
MTKNEQPIDAAAGAIVEVNINLEALEAIAKAATPGPWQWDHKYGDEGDTGLALTNDTRAEVVGAYNYHCCSFRDDPTVEDRDAEYIATFDPPTVLALIARIREAEAPEPSAEDHDIVPTSPTGRIDSPVTCGTCGRSLFIGEDGNWQHVAREPRADALAKAKAEHLEKQTTNHEIGGHDHA